METIASFMVSAILSLGTSKRRWEYSQAMVLPLASTIVETAGMSPSRSWADPLATMSEARLDIRPTPPTTGNSSAATITLANRQHQASLMIVEPAGGRSDMGYSVLRPLLRACGAPVRVGEDTTKFSRRGSQNRSSWRDWTLVPKKL